MLILIIVSLLKITGIIFGVPALRRQYGTWKGKQVEKLHEHQKWYVKHGKKPKISRLKRGIYKVTSMPLAHLWKYK